MIFQWYLICFEILYQLLVFYPQGDPLGVPWDLKNQLYVKLQLQDRF